MIFTGCRSETEVKAPLVSSVSGNGKHRATRLSTSLETTGGWNYGFTNPS
jgi:hypothetical protein